MVDISQLQYPKKSHRKVVTFPQESCELAEFLGLMLGDGGINNPWQISITMNSERDRQYSEYIADACHRLFGISAALRERKTTKVTVVVLSSTDVVDFLVSKGLPRGNKLAGELSIPNWIMSNTQYRVACVRGLMDTDGCLYVHRHKTLGRKYTNIGLCFTNFSDLLVRQVADIFIENGITPHIAGEGTRIYLYSAKATQNYLRIFGTSNERISNVYRSWKEEKAPDLRCRAAVV